jgi:hypothetical protein
MDPNAKFSIKGNVELYEFPEDFTYHDYLALKKNNEHIKYLKDKGDNLVVDAGLTQIIDLMIATDTLSLTHCRVGSGTNTPAAGDTDMQTIIGSGVTVTNRYRSGSVAYFDTFFSTSANNGSWEETGIANAATGSDLLCRRKFSATFTKASTNTALISWSVTLSSVAD